MGDIRVDGGRCGSRSKETIHFSSQNTGETVGSYGIGGYRYHTSHYYSHKPGDHGRFLRIPGSSHNVDGSIRENERGDSRGGGTRRGSRSRYISQY